MAAGVTRELEDRTLARLDPRTTGATGLSLEARIQAVGRGLADSLPVVLEALPAGASGPQELARSLGLDKVLVSRLLKALRAGDPVAFLFHAPGPAPLRRFLRAAARGGAPSEAVDPALAATAAFDALIRQDAGDRSTLDAMLSAWLPEVRTVFEERRRQAVYKGYCHLKGVSADTNLSVALIHPSADGERLDIVWVMGLLGVQRVSPGARVHLATRRFMGQDGEPRCPVTLEGERVDNLEGLRLDAFCSAPPAPLDVETVGECVHYVLADDAFGPRWSWDLLLAEANRDELPRHIAPERRHHVFAEISTPARMLHFDVLLHESLGAAFEPSLVVYDTSFEGVADVNDQARDASRLSCAATLQPLERGLSGLRADGVPHYIDLLDHVTSCMGWDGDAFGGHRLRLGHPLYGSQVVVALAARA